MLNCRQVTELCSQEHDRPLTPRERILLRVHLMMCAGCTRLRQQMDFISKASGRFFRAPTGASRPEDGRPPE